jgi:antitoxin CcdA
VLTRSAAARTRKKPANLSVDSVLLEEAKRMKLNLSQIFETSLDAAICQRRREEWLKNNRAALDAYNEHIEADGVFSDGLRSF